MLQDGFPRLVRHFHYTAWPDHGVPSTSKSLVRFVSLVRKALDNEGDTDKPTIIHCRLVVCDSLACGKNQPNRLFFYTGII